MRKNSGFFKNNNNGYNNNRYITLIIFTLDSLVSDVNTLGYCNTSYLSATPRRGESL